MEDELVQREIVDTARAYFLKYGYSRVSTAEIADEAGRSKKTLYKHFPTKEALLNAVVERVNRTVEEEILGLLANTELGPEARVREVLERIGVHLASVGAVLYNDLESREPALYTQARKHQREILTTVLSGLINQAITAKIFRSDIDVATTISTYLASVEALAKPATVASHADEPTALFKTLVGWVVAGMK
jgi:AcrR family transcriptional regulator